MKKIFYLFLFLSIFNAANSEAAAKFEISSKDITHGKKMEEKHAFNGFGCTGKNISPHISWKNSPKGTKSFALTVYDPDAPTGSGWWHYVAVNIPVNYNEFPSDFGSVDKFTIKDGINQVRNDFGTYEFGGSCPPKGDKPHRYFFTIYALKTERLDIKEDSTAAYAGYMINANMIAKAQIMMLYGR